MHSVCAPKVFMENNVLIDVQVCHIAPRQQFLRMVRLKQGSTVEQAITASGVLQEFSDISLEQIKVGIYSRIKSLDTILTQNDRVEIYRPLLVDPMAARRTRAKKKKA